MTTVPPFEADILRVLHAVLGRGPTDRAVGIILRPRARPGCLSRVSIALIEETLTKGCIQKLSRRGNWRHDRFLTGGRVVEGRLWERTAPDALALTFSRDSLEFLIRLVSDQSAAWTSQNGPTFASATLGDSLLLFLVFETFRSTLVGERLRKLPLFWSQGLCRLAFPVDFAEVADAREPDFADCLEPSRLWILEALQETFIDNWLAGERQKRQILEPARVVAVAREQSWVIDAFCQAVETIGRHDLARFLLRVVRELLSPGTGPESWTGQVMTQGLRLADRGEVNRAMLAVLNVLERLQGWELEARNVGYFDEGYTSSQLWKSTWEQLGGDDLRLAARTLFRAADPLAL